MSGVLLAALLVGGGLAAVVSGMLLRVREREQALAEILELPFGERDVPVAAVTESRAGGLFEGPIEMAGRMVEQFDARGDMSLALERARIPLRPGEYVMLTLAATAVVTALLVAITEQWLLGVAGALATVMLAWRVPTVMIARRRKAFEAQLPDALSLIASSLSAGHTFLRSIQMMTEEADPPLAEEFARVVYETQLGDPVVDALERMALRLDVRDLVWVVQAIRIQQSVGGKLADLLHSLADFIRAREEIRREINVLTAEGRISAWVLGALPVMLLLTVQAVSPDYMEPMFKGWGFVVLGATAASVAVGVTIIRRMVRIEV